MRAAVMQGMLGGMVIGGLVSVLALSVLSVMSEQPAGVTPPVPPLVEAPQASAPEPLSDTPQVSDTAENVDAGGAVDATAQDTDGSETGVNTPVGSVSVDEPVAPDVPVGDALAPAAQPAPAPSVDGNVAAPRADTDPLDEPSVVAVEGSLEAPQAPSGVDVSADPVDPVFPNPQSLAPQTPDPESDLTVSTTPAAPTVVIEPEAEQQADAPVAPEEQAPSETAQEDVFVVDLGVDGADAPAQAAQDEGAEAAPSVGDDTTAQGAEVPSETETGDSPETDVSPAPEGDEIALAPQQPRLQLQGDGNSLLGDRGTGVTIRRPGSDDTTTTTEPAEAAINALVDFAAQAPDVGAAATLAVVLIDDGTMSAAAAALSGLPFPVTIALDPDQADATAKMDQYRAAGYEVVALAKLPEGAVPSDVEVTLQSVFQTLPESLAILDIGNAGLQADRDVTAQAMDALASTGRGFVTVSQGLNTASRAAEQAGVPTATVYRDLDSDGQDARVIRRFVDQAAFRARQSSGVVLVGRLRPDTLSALILWGTANTEEQVALVPLSVVLNEQ